MERLKAIVLLLAVGACAYPTYQDPAIRDLDSSQFVVLDNRWQGCPFCIDKIIRVSDNLVVFKKMTDASNDQEAFHLPPGQYRIIASYEPYNISQERMATEAELLQGHRYSVKVQTCYMLCFRMKSYSADMWIEDLDTGEVIAGCRQGVGCV